MKRLLLFIGIIVLFGCEEISDTCWLCTYQTRNSVEVWNDWYQRWDTKYSYTFDKQKKICDDKPPYSMGQYPKTKISCVEL